MPKDPTEAMRWYRKAAAQGSAPAQNGLAWLLATSSDPAIRNGSNALALAEKAVASTHRKEPNLIDTLAAAYAEVGQFDKAISLQKEAIALQQDEKLKREFLSRLKLYESHSPYRE